MSQVLCRNSKFPSLRPLDKSQKGSAFSMLQASDAWKSAMCWSSVSDLTSLNTAQMSHQEILGIPSPVLRVCPSLLQAGGANSQPHPSDYDPTNTTLFIGGLSSSVTEEDLRVLFGRYGDIVYTKIPPGKGCGFVQFVQRPAAEAAMGQMQVQRPLDLQWPSHEEGCTQCSNKTELRTALAMCASQLGAGHLQFQAR